MSEQKELLRYVRTLARYERLLEISRALISTLDITALLEQIVLAATELTDTEASSILLVDKNTGVMRFEAAVDPQGLSLDSIEVPIEGSIAGWVVSQGEPLLIADVSSEPRWSSKVDEESAFKTRNMLAVPMKTRERVIGCLEALNKHGDQAFSDEDVNTLSTLAAQAAIAIENARLFQQSDLIAEMVHELRTPLAAITATTHVLKRPEIDTERRSEMIDTIQQETKRLTRMTTEFLDLARLESGRSRLKFEETNLGEILRETTNAVRAQAETQGISVNLSIDPPELPIIKADAEKITQVMFNLLTNAIKYNRPDGQVDVNAVLYDEYITTEVRDTGHGISEDNLPHIFEKFFRIADHEGVTQGTGLGLAVAKRIIDGHGGRIWIESEVGVGTAFIFNLPLMDKEG